MTVIAAIRHEDKDGNVKVVIGSDSAITMGESQKLISLKGNYKLVQFNGFVVGICGIGPLQEVLEQIKEQNKKLKKSIINDRSDAGEFGKVVFKLLKKELECSPLYEKFEKHFSESIDDLLIATRNKIFLVCTDLTVYEFDKFMATGIGDALALGAMEALYPNSKDPIASEDLLTIMCRVLDITCIHNIACSPPFHIIEV